MRFHLSLLAVLVLSACASSSKSESEQKLQPVPAPAQLSDTKAQPATVPVAQGKQMVCEVKGDKRVLEIRNKGNGCELAYIKNGTEGIVATSANGHAHCEATQTKMIERLKGSGFNCPQ